MDTTTTNHKPPTPPRNTHTHSPRSQTRGETQQN